MCALKCFSIKCKIVYEIRKKTKYSTQKVKIMSGFTKSIENIRTQNSPERTKLWQLDHDYHCSLIGTCLSLEEVRRLMRPFYSENIDTAHPYELHTAIVTMISYSDYRSKKIQNYLNKKFKKEINKTRKMNADELISEWKCVLGSAEIIGAYWAIMLHPCANHAIKRGLFGDVHMQSHMSGATIRVNLKRLKWLESERKVFKTEIKSQLSKYQKLQTDVNRLKTTIQNKNGNISELESQVKVLINSNDSLVIESKSINKKKLHIQVEKLTAKIDHQLKEIEHYKKSKVQYDQLVSELNYQLKMQKQAIEEYEGETEHLHYLLSQKKVDNKRQYKTKGLCGQCVLYVGGKASLIPYYRELIESRAGVFLHHDGGIEKNTQDLSLSLNRADLVIFPTNCISHDAVWKIKRSCKKQQKPYQYLKSPGLFSLSSVLEKIVTRTEVLDM